MSTANDVLRREAEWKAHLEICDCQIYRGESRELTPEAQVYYTKQAAAASELAEEVDELRHALDAQAAATLIEIDLLRQEHERALNAQHDRIESALSAALGDPDLGAYPGDPDGAPDLESLIAMVAGLRRQRDEARKGCIDLEAVYAATASDLQSASERIDIDQEVMTRLEGERDAARYALETARLTLLAEQGKPEGAASEGWRFLLGRWSKILPNGDIMRVDRHFWSIEYTYEDHETYQRSAIRRDAEGQPIMGRTDSDRAAMQAADEYAP